jgi:RNA polymerase sigma factor (sigma-70 family)
MLRFGNRLLNRARVHKVTSQTEGRAYKYYADLVWRLKKGDGLAWEHFVAEWGARLYSYLRYSTQHEEDAQQVLSDIMLAIVREMPDFDGRITLAAFVFSLAYRKVMDYWRKFGNPSWSSQPTNSMKSVAVTNATVGDSETAMYTIWPQLEAQAQQVLLLRYHAGLDVNEIADVLERSHEAIEFLLSQLHRQFQNEFLGNVGA